MVAADDLTSTLNSFQTTEIVTWFFFCLHFNLKRILERRRGDMHVRARVDVQDAASGISRKLMRTARRAETSQGQDDA